MSSKAATKGWAAGGKLATKVVLRTSEANFCDGSTSVMLHACVQTFLLDLTNNIRPNNYETRIFLERSVSQKTKNLNHTTITRQSHDNHTSITRQSQISDRNHITYHVSRNITYHTTHHISHQVSRLPYAVTLHPLSRIK